MTIEQIEKALKSTGLPVAEFEFAVEKPPPLIVYMVTDIKSRTANSEIVNKEYSIRVELYTEKKDKTSIKIVDEALQSIGLTYTQEILWISSEKMKEIIYEFEI